MMNLVTDFIHFSDVAPSNPGRDIRIFSSFLADQENKQRT